MKYFATRNADSREAENINNQVSYYKADTLIRNKYMTFEYDLYESKEKGKAEAKREMAAAMLADGEPIEKIVKYSGLSEKEVLELREARPESAAK
jgi:predicted transposase/invertase (TIGR01784 family)